MKARESAFTVALREATTRLKAPDRQLEQELRGALEVYRKSRETSRTVLQQRDAAGRVMKATSALKRELRRANAAFNLTPPAPWKPQEWTAFLPYAWRSPFEPQLLELRERVEAWMASTARPKGRPGNPHEGRFLLRVRTFETLRQHDVPIRINGFRGTAARVLALVLMEADRADGKPTKERAHFNGSQWRAWVRQYQQADKFLAWQEHEHGLRRAYLMQYLTLRTI